MPKFFIDTNIFLRILIKEDEKSFKSCFRLLQSVKTNKLKAATSNIVLSEIVWTLLSYYKIPKDKVSEALRGIINLRGLIISDEFQPEVALSVYEKKNVKFIDALIASNPDILSKKWIVVSYDHDFDKMGVKRMEPDEI